MNAIDVAVAVIENEQGQYLLSLRQKGQDMAGLWEFPGGKFEAGESVQDALVREIQEELAVTIQPYSELMIIPFDYEIAERKAGQGLGKSLTLKKVKVCLHVWRCVIVQGEIVGTTGNEGQCVRWVEKSDLSSYQFPDANKQILKRL